MNQRTRKLITIHKTSLPRDDIEKLYVSRKVGSITVGGVDASIRGLEGYIKRTKERLITAVSNSNDKIWINRNRIWKKNSMDISIDKMAKSYTRKPEHC